MSRNSRREEISLWGDSFGQIGAMLKRLSKRGVDPRHATRIRCDDGYADALAQVAQDIYHSLEWSDHKAARELMGGWFFGMPEWTAHYKVDFTRLRGFPPELTEYSLECLQKPDPLEPDKRICDTHFLYLGLSHYDPSTATKAASIEVLREHNWKASFTMGRDEGWKESVMWSSGHRFQWYLIRRPFGVKQFEIQDDEFKEHPPHDFKRPTFHHVVRAHMLINCLELRDKTCTDAFTGGPCCWFFDDATLKKKERRMVMCWRGDHLWMGFRSAYDAMQGGSVHGSLIQWAPDWDFAAP